MPVTDFRWLQREESRTLDIMNMSDEQQTGYILEVDLEYPKHLHESHNSFPLAPEHLTITEAMLSPYAKGKKVCCWVRDSNPRLMFHRRELKSRALDRSANPVNLFFLPLQNVTKSSMGKPNMLPRSWRQLSTNV